MQAQFPIHRAAYIGPPPLRVLHQRAALDALRECTAVELPLAAFFRLKAMQLAVMPGQRADTDQPHIVWPWLASYSAVGGEPRPDNMRLVCISPLTWHHRQLHRFEPEKGGKRKLYGGTFSQGIKRGTLVKHPKWGRAYVGGTMDGKLSLHDPQTGKRITQSANVADCRLIKLLRWKTRLGPLFPTT